VHLLTLDEPHREIRIQVRGTVEIDSHSGEGFQDQGRLSPLAYLAETPLTSANDELRQFSSKYLPTGKSRVDSLMNLSGAICDKVTYRKGATEVSETAVKAFKRGEGVCQDHSHIFIACCRAAGIPARYVSGYFYPGDVEEVASHAWVDAWLGDDNGWLSLDVTHHVFAADRHCRLAVGRDYMEACPIRGVRRGGGAEEMEVSVSIAQSIQQ
jgi:transglutaminase-like putative cysteine protease